jgi:hypothetical protein
MLLFESTSIERVIRQKELRSLCWLALFLNLKREQDHSYLAQFEYNPIESWLIGDVARKQRRASFLVADREIIEPALPGFIQMSFDTNSIIHILLRFVWLLSSKGYRLIYLGDIGQKATFKVGKKKGQ